MLTDLTLLFRRERWAISDDGLDLKDHMGNGSRITTEHRPLKRRHRDSTRPRKLTLSEERLPAWP